MLLQDRYKFLVLMWCAEHLRRFELLWAEEELRIAAPSNQEADMVCSYWLDQTAVFLTVSSANIVSSGCSCAIIGGIDAWA